jgi:hypothetical protein
MTNLAILKQAGIMYGIPLGNNVSGGDGSNSGDNGETATTVAVTIYGNVTSTLMNNGDFNDSWRISYSGNIHCSSLYSFPAGTLIISNFSSNQFMFLQQSESFISFSNSMELTHPLSGAVSLIVQINDFHFHFNISIYGNEQSKSGSISETVNMPISIFENTPTGGGSQFRQYRLSPAFNRYTKIRGATICC